MSTAVAWVGICSFALWCGVTGSVIADRLRGERPIPARAPWYVLVRALPDGSGVELLVRPYPNEMIVGSVEARATSVSTSALAELRRPGSARSPTTRR